jgi:hypothetical protein
MNTKKIVFISIVAIISFLLIVIIGGRVINNINNGAMRAFLYPLRKDSYLGSGDKQLARRLYGNVSGRQSVVVAELLAQGADPNYCIGEYGWAESNPLDLIAIAIFPTYSWRDEWEGIPVDKIPDVMTLNVLISAGADVNRRPYIWNRVAFCGNKGLEGMKEWWQEQKESDIKKEIDRYVADANRILRVFLEAGADPDKLGHPYPYSNEADFAHITDKKANEYFANGTRAINEAIEKGIVWESQVDLLLQYTTLDEESLKAAERSGDSAMVEKINALWEKQQAR